MILYSQDLQKILNKSIFKIYYELFSSDATRNLFFYTYYNHDYLNSVNKLIKKEVLYLVAIKFLLSQISFLIIIIKNYLKLRWNLCLYTLNQKYIFQIKINILYL